MSPVCPAHPYQRPDWNLWSSKLELGLLGCDVINAGKGGFKATVIPAFRMSCLIKYSGLVKGSFTLVCASRVYFREAGGRCI
jgi:hypothetical protein